MLTRPQEPTNRDRNNLMRQATVWADPAPRPSRRPAMAAMRVARAAGSLLTLVLCLAGIPVLLVTFVGWPLPHTLPSADEVLRVVGQADLLTTDTVVRAAAVLVWLIWAASVLYTAYIAFALAARTRIRLPQVPVPRLLKGMLTGLVPAVSVTVPAQIAAAAPPAATATADPAPQQRSANADAPAARAQTPNGRQAEVTTEHRVKAGDTLWDIAEEELGNPLRWKKDIFDRNKGRPQPDGRALRDPDIILPGWRLELPTDAPQAPADLPRPAPEEDPPTAATAPPSHRAGPTASPSEKRIAETPQATPSRHVQVTETDEHGITLSDGSWLPWSVAAGLTAATALMWLHRRRRYTGQPDDDAPVMPPPAVTAVQRATIRTTPATSPPSPAPDSDRLALQQATTPTLSRTVGITGEGAAAAARAAIVATLSAGGPCQPNLAAEVVTDRHTLTALFGPHADALAEWPRLHIADDVYDAVAAIDTRILRRSRILDTHTATDLDALPQEVSDEDPMPPVLLIISTPPPAAQAPVRASLDLGEALRITALIVGGWPNGATAAVAADGRIHPSTDQPEPGDRLPVLTTETALAALATLREAHTGTPADPVLDAKPVPIAAALVRRPAPPSPPLDTITDPPPTTAAAGAPPKAQLRVLGPPGIDHITAPGRPLRAKALEVAVLLACNPDGLSTRDIGEHTEPDARLAQSDQRVHTNISNLKHVLARAAVPRPNAYVIKDNGRYRLDPDTVDIDLWHLRDLLRTATTAPREQRTRALQTACDLYTGPLAQGKNYDWLQPHQETAQRWATHAHLHLAEELLPTDPDTAATLLDNAIRHDRYNEALYQSAMRARHAQGNPDDIPALLNALAQALADIGATPTAETLQLAQALT